MRLAFVVDPLDDLKAYKDSSIAMMREAARRGHAVAAFEARTLHVHADSVRCRAQALTIHDDNTHWYSPAGEAADARVADFDRVLMRKDPPFDQEYYYATLLLERAAAEGTTVVNDPREPARLEREARRSCASRGSHPRRSSPPRWRASTPSSTSIAT
jgi:glutathione synthase